MKTKKCFTCKQEKLVSEYAHRYDNKSKLWYNCRPCEKLNKKQYYNKNKEKFKKEALDYYYNNIEVRKVQKQNHYLRNKRRYKSKSLQRLCGITIEIYEQKLKDQNFKCLVCATPHTEKKKLVADHCHETGFFRGLICNSCNCALGLLKDSASVIFNLAKYIHIHENEGHNEITD